MYNQNEKIWICFLLSVYCLFKSFWAASLAARAAASGLMLERRSSSRVTTISRPIDWTISVGLYSNSTSPLIESYFSEFLTIIFQSILKVDFLIEEITCLVKNSCSYNDISNTVWIAVGWGSSVLKVAISVFFYRSWDTDRATLTILSFWKRVE